MELHQLTLSFEALSGGGPAIAIDSIPFYEYRDGARTDRIIGHKITVVFPKNKYAHQDIKVLNPQDQLSSLLENVGSVPVQFEGIKISIYKRLTDGTYHDALSVKATGVAIVEDDIGIDGF